MSRAKTIVGQGVLLYINGKPFGQVTGFQWSSETPREEIYGLDNVDPYEIAPTRTMVSATIELIRTLGDGGAEGAGMSAQFEDLPREKYFTVTLVERASDATLFAANQCALQSQQWSVSTRGILSGTISIKAISWYNETKK